MPAHDLEAGAVDQRETAAAGGQKCRKGRLVYGFVHPQRVQQRHESGRQISRRGQPETALHECERLHEHVIGRVQRIALVDGGVEGVYDVTVPGLVRIDDCQDGRRVDEQAHGSKASSRWRSCPSARSGQFDR